MDNQNKIKAKGLGGYYMHEIIPNGTTFIFCKMEFRIVTSFYDKEDFHYVLARFNKEYKCYFYEVWDADRVDLKMGNSFHYLDE